MDYSRVKFIFIYLHLEPVTRGVGTIYQSKQNTGTREPTRKNSPTWARAASFLRFLDYTTVGRTLDEGSARHVARPLPDNTQHLQDINAAGGIRTRNPSKRSALDTRLRPLDHWDWLFLVLLNIFLGTHKRNEIQIKGFI